MDDFTDSTYKGIVILEISRNLVIDTLYLVMVVNDAETGCTFKVPGKKLLGHQYCEVSSSQGKVARVLFRLNY